VAVPDTVRSPTAKPLAPLSIRVSDRAGRNASIQQTFSEGKLLLLRILLLLLKKAHPVNLKKKKIQSRKLFVGFGWLVVVFFLNLIIPLFSPSPNYCQEQNGKASVWRGQQSPQSHLLYPKQAVPGSAARCCATIEKLFCCAFCGRSFL